VKFTLIVGFAVGLPLPEVIWSKNPLSVPLIVATEGDVPQPVLKPMLLEVRSVPVSAPNLLAKEYPEDQSD
jgi:hypothetical protein